MKALQLTFDHPVKGNLRLRPLSGQEGRFKLQNFETDAAHVLKIETDELESGSWELVLEWELFIVNEKYSIIQHGEFSYR